MRTGTDRKRRVILLLTLFTAAVLYGLISLLNHYFLRTNSLDLGAYTNALYDYARFHWNNSLAFRSQPENLLADHFDLYLPLFSQLIWFFGTYTLLVVQIGAILAGGWGIYRLLSTWFPAGSYLPVLGMCAFLLYFPLFSALSFDYHSSVVAAMFVPWFILAAEKRKTGRVLLLLLIMLVAKEGVSLWMIFVTSGLAMKYRKDAQLRNLMLVMSVFCALYFVTVTSFVIPSFSNSHSFHAFPYRSLGSSPAEAFSALIHHPGKIITLLFFNTSGHHELDYVKAEFWVFALVTGFLLFRKPYYLWMLVPVFAQKLFSDNYNMWGVTAHYSIELAPVVIIGSFDVIARSTRKKTAKWLAFAVLGLSAASTIRLMDNTFAWESSSKLRIYQASHYRAEIPLRQAYALMKRIPPDAAVSAQNHFVPHLSLRDKVYTFPTIRDAEYILLNPSGDFYPLDAESFRNKTDSLICNPGWQPIFTNKDFVLLKRKP